MITIFSDPHIGCTRNSHTTPASRERLKLALFAQALAISNCTQPVVCCGDLFDQYWGDATTLSQGLDVYQKCEIVLLGNHDFSNRANADSAFQFLTDINSDIVGDANLAGVKRRVVNDITIQWVHHKMTQLLFDESLEEVEPLGGILLLHCNYNSGYATDEASLNLTREQAEKLLTKVDKIFIGHEHISRMDFDGRLIITGNTHPTSFSDISDKYVWNVDKDLNVTKELIWDAKKNALKFNYKSLFETIYLEGYQFLEITGVAERSELPKIARAIANLWKQCPDALMIKNSVTCEKQFAEHTQPVKHIDVLAQVSEELQGTKHHALWQSYLGRINGTG